MLIGIALFRLHAKRKYNEYKMKWFVCLPMMWHVVSSEPFGFGSSRHTAARQCICIYTFGCGSIRQVVACPLDTAQAESVALQTSEPS